MSADRDRAIRRARQKRVKQLKKAARRDARTSAAGKTPDANASSTPGGKAG